MTNLQLSLVYLAGLGYQSTYVGIQPDKEQVIKKLATVPVTEEDLLDLTFRQAKALGFKKWEEESNLYLFPQWMYPMLPEGIQVVDIFGKEETFSKNTHDDESRLGCLAYGIHIENTAETN